MYSYTIAQWLLFFYIYCFFGWCIESTWVSVHQKRFVNRGFLRGTWIPIYGFGAMAMLLAAVPAGGNWFWMFISGMFFASVLEYITGACMEKIFKVRYWDYSDKKFNLNGHICLGTSIAWGLLTIALTQFIHQPMERLVTEVPQFWSNLAAAVLSILFAADVAVSTKAALDFRRVLVALSTACLLYTSLPGFQQKRISEFLPEFQQKRISELQPEFQQKCISEFQPELQQKRFSEFLRRLSKVRKSGILFVYPGT